MTTFLYLLADLHLKRRGAYKASTRDGRREGLKKGAHNHDPACPA